MGFFSKTTNAKNSGNSTLERRTLPEPVYYVFSPHDDTVLVGIDVVVCKKNNYYTVSWWDPSHERRMGASHVMFNPDFLPLKEMMVHMTGVSTFLYRWILIFITVKLRGALSPAEISAV